MSLTRVAVGPLLDDVVRDAALEERARRIEAIVAADPSAAACADRRLLRSAVGNLYFNALKFSREDSQVVLRATVEDRKVAIRVEDTCGGLPPGKGEELFAPSVQRGADRSGFGFGLAIAQQAVDAQHGSLSVQDRPGVGCTFKIELAAA